MSDSQAEETINLLLVDDSPTNLLALESMLRAPDRNLVTASCGEDALRYLLDNDAAVVLLDVYMPGLDGLETAALIRGREKSQDIPIIFLTANSTGVQHLSRGYSLGAVDYIVKPVEPEILRSKVAVFVELFKKTREIKRQTQLLREKNLELENANLARLNMLIDLSHELAAEHHPEQVLAKFCHSSQEIVGAEEAAVGLLSDEDHALHYFSSEALPGETVSERRIPGVVKRALDRVVVEQRPLRLDESDALMLADETDSDSVQSFLGAPVLSQSGVCGWVYLLNKLGDDHFTEADERLAATLATQVASAYENARLYTEAQNHATQLSLEIAVRKQAEEERARLLVREQAARAEAELANRTKDEFLATVSHELRTPLTAILGWSQIVRSNKLNKAELTHALETIERNAQVQSRLIDDLLDVSRIISGKLRIESQIVELSTIIAAAIDAVKPALEAKKIKFTNALLSEACPVMGDANRLQQVFWNLFSNAVKFTPKGGQISVTSQRRDREVQVSVTDNGVGIDGEFLPHIFNRFSQADGSTTRAQGGLGLGLAIVRHLVELHQGSVEVESQGKGRGATFTIVLPIAHATVESSLLERKSNMLSLNAAKILHGIRILVVDDEPDSRDLVATILTRCGGEVRSSASADEALQTFQDWHPDLLISDIGMPTQDGYDLIKRLRKLRSKRAEQIPAVALTAYATDEDRKQALSAGFQVHLAKPVEPESLVTSVAAALGREASTE